MHAVLCANAPFFDAAADLLRATVRGAELLVGVDGGARTLRRLGLSPQVVTGDGDSLTDDERTWFASQGARLIPTPDQDYTDLDKALQWVRAEGATKVTVFGATGGRLDHSYSVLSALLKHAPTLSLALVDETARYEAVVGCWECAGEERIGRTLSLMALGRVEGITTTGVQWPLTEDWLAPGQRDGTLNRITEATVTVRAATPGLIVMLHHV